MRTAPYLRSAMHSLFGMIWAVAVLLLATSSNSTAQTFTSLASFTGTNGANPLSSLVQRPDGSFYGTTQGGGNPNCAGNGCGTIFKITPDGTLVTVYDFCSQPSCTDGLFPLAGLVPGNDGNFYGTTSAGGTGAGGGTVFKITPGGMLTTISNFSDLLVGASPNAPLVLATDGNFYGTTSEGGGGSGSIFKVTPSGALTDLYDFCSGSCPIGILPVGIVQATDGNFYGTVENGANNDCVNGCGAVFRMTPSGTVTSIYRFCSLANCADGYHPLAGLVQGTDGNFYGTTSGGGTNNAGTVFKLTPNGSLTTLHSFTGSDGAGPSAALVQATDAELYGTTASGGVRGGTIFKITTGGALTTLYDFCPQRPCPDGTSPEAALLQASNGIFYGTTYLGGTGLDGTVFSLSVVSPVAVQFVPVTPCRVVDTRSANGPFGGPPISGNSSRAFPLSESDNPCGIPSTAVAYSLNVTVVPQHGLGYLTIWPTGQGQPLVSTLNSPDGRTKANAAIVPAGTPSGSVSVFVTDTTNVILDVDGYFTAPGTGTLQFYPLTPCRVVDTRATNFPPGLGAPSFGNNEARELPVLANSPCLQGLPNQPLAYSFNVTAVPHPVGQRLNYLTIWPSDQQQPVVSTLNNPTATVVANAAIVPAAANGDVSVYTYNSTDVLIDVNGYFAAPGSGGYSFYPVAPCRTFDSRNNNGQPFTGELTVNVAGSPCAPPATAAGYVFNATVVPSPRLPYLTLWPHGEQEPVVSTLNAYDGFVTSNMAVVPNIDGSTNADAAQGSTQLILDVAGYFAP